MRYICTSIVATLLLAGTTFAATLNVPGDYTTIQDAINASSDGDVIQIGAGTFNEYGISPDGQSHHHSRYWVWRNHDRCPAEWQCIRDQL